MTFVQNQNWSKNACRSKATFCSKKCSSFFFVASCCFLFPERLKNQQTELCQVNHAHCFHCLHCPLLLHCLRGQQFHKSQRLHGFQFHKTIKNNTCWSKQNLIKRFVWITFLWSRKFWSTFCIDPKQLSAPNKRCSSFFVVSCFLFLVSNEPEKPSESTFWSPWALPNSPSLSSTPSLPWLPTISQSQQNPHLLIKTKYDQKIVLRYGHYLLPYGRPDY